MKTTVATDRQTTSPAQLQRATQPSSAEPTQGYAARTSYPVPATRPNRTGLPDQLKAGVESLSGYSLDDVQVHYNSTQPAQLQALAYAQGTDIHVAPGQEKHLPHEAWHVVQQKQGRVVPTLQTKSGVEVNDDRGLEGEANAMGARAVHTNANTHAPLAKIRASTAVVQKVVRPIGATDNLIHIKNRADNAVYKSTSTTTNDNVWLKMDEEIGQAKAAADFINMHAIYHNTSKNRTPHDWSISAPEIRSADLSDLNNLSLAIDNSPVVNHGTEYGTVIGQGIETNQQAHKTSKQNLKQAVHSTITSNNFSKVSVAADALGTHKPTDYETDLAKQQNSKKEREGYVKGLGYMQLMDLVLSNEDRGAVGAYNEDNYKISPGTNHISMLDNVERGKLGGQMMNGTLLKQDNFIKTNSSAVLEALRKGKGLKKAIKNSMASNPAYNRLLENDKYIKIYSKSMKEAHKNLPDTLATMQEKMNSSSDIEYKEAVNIMLQNAASMGMSPSVKKGKIVVPKLKNDSKEINLEDLEIS